VDGNGMNPFRLAPLPRDILEQAAAAWLKAGMAVTVICAGARDANPRTRQQKMPAIAFGRT